MIQRDNEAWAPAETAQLDWRDEAVPESALFGDIYYSAEDGLAESTYTFLDGNDITARLSQHPTPRFTIGETGFGTGLNFLLTWQAWRRTGADRPRLHYVATEKYPLSQQALTRALAAWPALAGLADELIEHWPVPIKGQHRLMFEQGQVILDLWIEDSSDAFTDLAEQERLLIDAWYLDGFAPARNPDMWRAELFEAMAALSRPNATLATFTAAGDVRRGLASAGFDVTLVSGFGAKRDSIRARWTGPAASRPVDTTRWDISATSADIPEHVMVIGAGLAGAATANALARRGIRVSVIEQSEIAAAASGNEQGVLYTRLSRRHSTLTDFALQSFLFAHRQYRALLENGGLNPDSDGALCGCFQQSGNAKDLDYLRDALSSVPALAEVLDSEQASEHLGIEQGSSGYWLPRSGWLHPPAVCRALLDHPSISVTTETGPVRLSRKADGRWCADFDGGTVEADCAVVCGGVDAANHPPTAWLPLQPIRGQTTSLPATAPLSDLRAVLCHEGYIAPRRGDSHCIGATFAPGVTRTQVDEADSRYNLSRLAEAVPSWLSHLDSLDPGTLPARVGLRCASPDYLPIVGPVPDRDAFLQEFANLRNNAKQTIISRGPMVPGLYVNTGHGSRGLSSTPLTAECLAAEITGEPMPLSRHLRRALLPARFLVRDLKRGKA